MKIMMVRPAPAKETIGLQHLMIVEPLELEILGALARSEDKVIISDLILEKRTFMECFTDIQPEILCVTGYITNVKDMIAFCALGKQYHPGLITIAGGVHCEVCPDDLNDPVIDYRVVRNAASVFTDLLNFLEGKNGIPPGILRFNQTLKDIVLPPLNFTIPLPDRTLTQKYRDRYFYIFQEKVALIKTAFGCPYDCNFCFCRVITGGKYYQRPLQDVMIELESIREKEIYIVDDDFLFDRRWLLEFVDEIRNRNIDKHFLVYGRADFIAANPDVMKLMADIGLKTVIVGFESFSDQELDRYNKKTNAALYEKTMQVLHQARVDCFATIIVSPEWDRADFRHMVRKVKSLGIHFVNLQPLTPLPGTGMKFEDTDLLIARKEYEKWDLAHQTIPPLKLSVSDYYEELLRAYMSILYSPRVLLKYLITYRPVMLWKMFKGGWKVNRQYRQKIKESKQYA